MVTVRSKQKALCSLANKLSQSSPEDSLLCRDAAAELRIHLKDNARLISEAVTYRQIISTMQDEKNKLQRDLQAFLETENPVAPQHTTPKGQL